MEHSATMVLRPFVEEPKGSVANYPYFERGKDSTMAYLYRLFQERIVMFDGAMGTMIQKYKLGEEDYRGERFKVSDASPPPRLPAVRVRIARGAAMQNFGLRDCIPPPKMWVLRQSRGGAKTNVRTFWRRLQPTPP